MASRQQLENALIAAHEAGDTEAASLIAGEIKSSSLAARNPAEYDPNSPAYKTKYGALAGSSGYDNFMAGAGKSVMDMGRGLGQLVGLHSREEQDAVNARDAELMGSGAGLAGNISGTIATTLIPGGMLGKVGGTVGKVGQAITNPQSIRAAAAVGAGLGALQPVGTEQSRTQNILLGGLTGGATQGVVQGIGRIAQPIKKALSSVDEKAVATLEAAGVPLDAAQRSGSQRAMQVKRFLGDNPFTAGGQTKQVEKTAAGFTRAALKEIGESADTADEEVLGQAATRIGKAFDDIANRTDIKADNQLLDDLVDISKSAPAELESAQAQVIINQVDEVMSKAAGGSINGQAYQSIKSTLDRISGGPNQQVGFWARALRERLDEALQRSAQGADYAALKTARKQYGALQGIISAVNPDGNVSPAKLYNATNVKAFGQKKAMATGIRQTQLQKLAKAGKRIIPERMPNSGTTPRALLQSVLPALAGGAYGASQDGGLGDVAKYAALGAGAPYLAQRAMNSPAFSQYLTQGLGGGARAALVGGPQTSAGLIARQAPLAGLLALQAQE
jgi:hypothetical protein